MTKEQLCKKLAIDMGLTDIHVLTIINAALKEISHVVIEGEGVTFRGFGTFSQKKLASRKTYNPATGESQTYPERKTMKFVPTPAMRKRIDPENLNAEMRKLK